MAAAAGADPLGGMTGARGVPQGSVLAAARLLDGAARLEAEVGVMLEVPRRLLQVGSQRRVVRARQDVSEVFPVPYLDGVV